MLPRLGRRGSNPRARRVRTGAMYVACAECGGEDTKLIFA